jgi:Na+-driven multidrug efflux pump
MELLKSNIKSIYFKYLFASMGSAIVMSIYNFVDTIAVGQSEGPNGTAAMAVIAPLYGATVFLPYSAVLAVRYL